MATVNVIITTFDGNGERHYHYYYVLHLMATVNVITLLLLITLLPFMTMYQIATGMQLFILAVL
jgi:hypothetical protein